MRKPVYESRFPTRSDKNRAVQPQKMARGLKFLILKVEGLYYLCCENNGADYLCLCFRIYIKKSFLLKWLKLFTFTLYFQHNPHEKQQNTYEQRHITRKLAFRIYHQVILKVSCSDNYTSCGSAAGGQLFLHEESVP